MHSTWKRFFAATLFFVTAVCQSSAMEENIIWVKSEVYPTGAGTVYVDWTTDNEKVYDTTSEFKRHSNGAISTAFIWSQPADGWLLSGYARDNGDKTFSNEDKQVKVNPDGLFTGVYDPTPYSGSSSSEAYALAEEAMQKMTEPTDLIFTVFTKGAVSRVATDEIGHGNAYTDKLSNEPGDEVTFTAYGESVSLEAGGVDYYKFSHWTNADGETVGTDRDLKVTAKGMDIYYAHFTACTQDEYKATEKDPHKSESYYQTGIQTVKADSRMTDGKCYNLKGQAVAHPAKGLYIINRRKVIMK